ncbi:cleavage stimulation factor subunit 2-like [Corticium candelabrum]|uniref:cleavage stimulation factor subunit 2-like n=1 Tax=Corticium candelabrum TaxID=121492 RepID=UPI002E26135B|nr:cleavage stimulation factor subunit 2-like [Corticium candelabrum]
MSQNPPRERANRSVFVGNIPYDATEENLQEIFSQVGPVVSLRLVYDRDSGKPKGYGFCEYDDPETASSAIRNLNGYEMNGRSLRVDGAATERRDTEFRDRDRDRDRDRGLGPLGHQADHATYGYPVPPEDAPDAIKKAVSRLPPEQMFELMKEMKVCIRDNPEDARRMLLQNPQLAYALLQAQLIMKIIDPKVADAILHSPYAERQVPQHLGAVDREHPVHHQPAMPPHRPIQQPPQQPPPIREPMPMGPPSSGPPSMPLPPVSIPPSSYPPRSAPPPASDPRGPPPGRADQLSSTDQEKAALIMQVLSLSDEQIASLPPDQRHSILLLKDQIAHSTGR